MRIIEVIESKRWLNKTNGRTASVYGAVPWTSDTERDQWTLEVVGFTWRLSNGTVGLGRQAVKTKNEAIEIMVKFNGDSK